MLYKTRNGLEEGQRDADLLAESGITSELWSSDEVVQSEPSITPEILGGIFYPQDAQISPSDFVESLSTVLQRMGAAVVSSTEVTGFGLEGRNITRVQTTRGEFYPRTVVLAAGVDSAPLARKLAIRLPIEAGKGYSFSIPSTFFQPSRALLFSEAKVAVTPFVDKVRFGGTLELSGLDNTIKAARLQALRESSSSYLSAKLPPVLNEEWSGLRPCTPDGLPLISVVPTVPNLVVASGHAMLGVSLGPITGKLAAQLACGEPTGLDVSAFTVSRFG
jgi:D-amino-acid dehydrogenase